MPECKLRAWMVPDPTYPSRAIAECACDTHGWRFPTGAVIAEGVGCPIGVIEKAVEDGLARITDTIYEVERRLREKS